MDLLRFLATFDTEQKCAEHLARVRWPDGPVCDKCGSVNAAGKSQRPRFWHCRSCGHMFSVTAGTPLADTRLPLPKWFAAIFLIVNSSKGVSSVALGRQIGVGQKTAWFLGQRIRAMFGVDDEALLKGIVEADETYLGGKRRKGQKSKRDHEDDQHKGRGGTKKLMVVTAVERGGKAKARRGKTHSSRTIARAVYDWANRDSILITDNLPAYRWIGRKFLRHHRVNHSREEWARSEGDFRVHTNTVESFNATIKRAIIGVWHWFSIKHSDRYLVELFSRWDWRNCVSGERINITFRGMSFGPLPWKVLTA